MRAVIFAALLALGGCSLGACTTTGGYGSAGPVHQNSSIHPWCDNPSPHDWRQCGSGN